MEDDDVDTPASSFPMEMSQDCIVWDESKNRDLREIAISPMNDSASRPNHQSTSKDSSNPTKPSRLDSIKRRLGGTTSSEQEVDAVFQFLEDHEGDNMSLQNQTAGNARNVRPKVASNRPTIKTSLASWRNRHKQRVARTTSSGSHSVIENHRSNNLGATSMNQRRRRRGTTNQDGGLLASPVPPVTSPASKDLDDGAFEELLKEFSTPQSVERKRPPMEEKEIGSNINSSMPPPTNSSQHTRSLVTLPTQTITPPNPHSNSGATTMTKPHQPPNPRPKSSAPPIANRYHKILPEPGMAKENQSTGPSQPKPSTVVSSNRNPLQNKNTFKPHVVPKSSMPPPAIPPTATIPSSEGTTVTTKKEDVDDDNFGDLDLGDIANLDSLLSMKSSTQAAQQPPILPAEPKQAPVIASTVIAPCQAEENKDKEVEDEFGDFPDMDFDAMDAAMTEQASIQQQPKSPKSPKAVIGDEFGDFPDMDFDVIDQVIQQRSSTQESLPSSSNLPSVTSMACHLPPNAAVKNPRRTAVADLSFITFTRYKVVEVLDNTTSYTKSLSVASWTDEMRKEQDLEKEFHRYCNVTETSSNHPEGGPEPWNSVLHNQKCYKHEGLLHLRGEWYHTPVSKGDVVHLCSVSGRFRTDPEALPIVLHNPAPTGSDNDDLVLVTHPDILMTPTTISETVTCSRRAVLKSRIGSTGLTSKAALFGTMRHDLFGSCLRQENFDLAFSRRVVHKLARQNAEGLLACDVTTAEAQEEILKVFPVIRDFVAEYTALRKPPSPELLSNAIKVAGHGYQSNIKFLAQKVYSIEEPIISPELALKGNVDAILETLTLELNDKHYMPNPVQNPVPQHSLMCLELKTGHNQKTQNAHMAQLALYTLMLQSRFGLERTKPGAHLHGVSEPSGASTGGILLYLNQQGTSSAHVSPLLNEGKSLVGQRNIVANGMHRSSRPRGVVLSYGDGSRDKDKQTLTATLFPPPPADLPEVMSNSHSCQRCYVNRECILYAASETNNKNDPDWLTGRSHADLLVKFTGKLQESDLEYFRKWDRLIDLEADASSRNIAASWLTESHICEQENGESVSCLVFDHPEPSRTEESSHVLIAFHRAKSSPTQAPFDKIALSSGCHIIVSTDGTSLVDSLGADTPTLSNRRTTKFRYQMHVVRGIVEEVQGEKLLVMTRREELERIRDLVLRHRNFCEKNGEPYSELQFRFDKDTSSVGIGTLRQNLINFLTADFADGKDENLSQANAAKKIRLPKLRDAVIGFASPRFDLRVPMDSIFHACCPPIPGCDMDTLSAEFYRLNPDQQQAVTKVVSASDYTLMQGLPGTGKTTTLAYMARLLAARGKRVLITSYTHAAVDNVVLKLMETGVAAVDDLNPVPALVRIGQRSSCHTKVRSLLATEIALRLDRIHQDECGSTLHTLSQSESYHNFDNPSVESLKKVTSAARIVCSSALSVPRSPLLMHENFDVVIIDEAGQISQPAILGAIAAADSFVLVGDHKQLPPLVNSQLAEAGGYGVSMLQRLAEKHPGAIASLTYQYRMNMAICRLSSEAVYGGRLKCGSEEVKCRTLQMVGFPHRLPQASSKSVYPWLKSVVDPHKSVVFVDTDNVKKNPRPANERRPGSSSTMQDEMEALEGNIGGRSRSNVINQTEVSLIRIILQGLFSCGVSATSVGVISPFRAQLRVLEEDPEISSWKGDGLELSTIDRYQGRDKEVIIISSVRSNNAGKVGRLMLDMRRLNVALTRAKSKLIIVGSFSTLSTGSDPLRPLLGRVNKRGQRFLLPENAVQCYNF